MNERKRNVAADKRAASLTLKPRKMGGKWGANFVLPEKTHIADVCMTHRRVEVIDSLNKRFWK